MRLFLSISLCVLLMSCGVFNSPNNQGNIDLVEAKKKWGSLNNHNYTFKNSRTCECPPPYHYTVVVVNGEIKDVDFEKQEQLNYESKAMIIGSTRTIDELFDLFEQYKETAAHFEVEFHEELGYPTKINIDPSIEMADEEIILEISNFASINN